MNHDVPQPMTATRSRVSGASSASAAASSGSGPGLWLAKDLAVDVGHQCPSELMNPSLRRQVLAGGLSGGATQRSHVEGAGENGPADTLRKATSSSHASRNAASSCRLRRWHPPGHPLAGHLDPLADGVTANPPSAPFFTSHDRTALGEQRRGNIRVVVLAERDRPRHDSAGARRSTAAAPRPRARCRQDLRWCPTTWSGQARAPRSAPRPPRSSGRAAGTTSRDGHDPARASEVDGVSGRPRRRQGSRWRREG